MRRLPDNEIIGVTYNFLTPLRFADSANGRRMVVARCSCGKVVTVAVYALRYGSVKSCGHLVTQSRSKRNKCTYNNDGTISIHLSSGKEALIDAGDLELVMTLGWYASQSRDGRYEARSTSKPNGKEVAMHRLIVNAPNDKWVDHKNRNPLDNRRSNLRICDPVFNKWNMKIDKRNTTGFKGVKRCRGKFHATICIDGKRTHLGTYDTREDAAAAYDAAAIRLRGAFATTNASLGSYTTHASRIAIAEAVLPDGIAIPSVVTLTGFDADANPVEFCARVRIISRPITGAA